MDSGMKATLAVLRLPVAHTTDIPPPSSPPSTSHHPEKPRGLGTPTEARSSENQRSLEKLPMMYTSRNHLRNYLHFDLIFLLGDNFALLGFYKCCQRGTDCSLFWLSFQGCLQKQLWKLDLLSPSGAKSSVLTAFYRRFSLPELRFLFCNATYCVCGCHLARFTSPWGNWAPGNGTDMPIL